MDRYRLRAGEAIAAASAALLYALMFFDWFGVESVSHSNLLAYLNLFVPAKNAWEALDFIPIVLVAAIGVALVSAVARLGDSASSPSVPVNAAIGALGLASALLILYRVIDPPEFGARGSITLVGTVQSPAFLALAAAAGIALGGFWSMVEGIREKRADIVSE